MNRKPNVPAIFLCALALGVWLGASWHAASKPVTLAGANCGSCCRLPGSISKQIKTSLIAAVESSECMACFAGALLQDTPVATETAVAILSTPIDDAPRLASVDRAPSVHLHPPERGPPA